MGPEGSAVCVRCGTTSCSVLLQVAFTVHMFVLPHLHRQIRAQQPSKHRAQILSTGQSLPTCGTCGDPDRNEVTASRNHEKQMQTTSCNRCQYATNGVHPARRIAHACAGSAPCKALAATQGGYTTAADHHPVTANYTTASQETRLAQRHPSPSDACQA